MAGRRFETTMARDMERVASRLHEVDDRKTVCEKLRERKLGNTQTSIVFGFDEMNYQTDAQSRQKDILRKQDRGGAIDGKAMKKTLTATHFVLGNDDVKWTTNATQEDPTGRMHEFIGVLNADTTKKSSCYFGSDAMTYRTTAHDSMAMDMDAASKQGTSNMRQQAKKLKAELSGHNFVLGNDMLNYSTTAHDAFQYESKSALAAQGTLIKEVKADLRKEHFNFGNEVVHYETDAQRSMKNGEITKDRLEEMKSDSKAAQDLKIKLLATSVVIGDDPNYMR